MPHNVLYDTSGGGGVKEAVAEARGIVKANYPQGNEFQGRTLIPGEKKIASERSLVTRNCAETFNKPRSQRRLPRETSYRHPPHRQPSQ
jgi:hypothetical protein